MKNLKHYLELSMDLELVHSEGETILSSAAFDVESSRIFLASSTNVVHTLHLPLSRNALSETEQLPLDPGDQIVAMDYLIEKEALVIGTFEGFLLLHVVDTKTTEIVGKVEGGVKSIACSPDGALLAVTAGLGQLLIMTPDWDVQYEIALDPEISKSFVSGGDNDISINQFKSSICWRGDGKYFATLFGIQDSSFQQRLRIWERESGTLHSFSDLKNFMGTSLDWMPSGAKVAAAYDRTKERHSPLIVFFERNGLERNSFVVDIEAKARIDNLKWNSNSDLLAASFNCDQYDAIKVWSFSNNHWYLKQDLRYSKNDGVKFFWVPTKPLHLISWTVYGKITSYDFAWTSSVTDKSVALVVDNTSLLVTPLALFLMPPPLSLFELKFPSTIKDVAFFSKASKNYIAASLSDNRLCAMELSSVNMWDHLDGKVFDVETCQTDPTLSTLMHLTWLDSHILLGVSCIHAQDISVPLQDNVLSFQEKKPGHSCLLQEIVLVCSEDSAPGSVGSSGWHTKVSKTLSLEEPVIGIVANPSKRCSAFIQMVGGYIYEYSSSLDNKMVSSRLLPHELKSEHGFSSSCPWMKAVLVRDDGILRPLVFGLDENGRLHCGKRTLCNNCSSFSFYSVASEIPEQVVTHLVLTTKQDVLFIIGIDDILEGNSEVIFNSYNGTKSRKEEKKDYVQIWERGAKVVGAIHGDEATIIVQTNRGNLECIYPRKLVLVSIVNALLQKRFNDAMVMVRRHRIDLNVIVDYCGWTAFLRYAKDFVRQVNNLGHITEFVSAIKNENVFDTLYKTYIKLPSSAEEPSEHAGNFQNLYTSKVSSILLAVQEALKEELQESPARELCILTTLARSEPPALEEALSRIKEIRELELLQNHDDKMKLFPSAEESLKHLVWLTNPDAVYEAALGLYDLNLAAIVALNSQKDPKEFLPYLRGLEQMNPAVMRYTIDLRLHRYESALRNIVSAGNEYYEDCMKLLKNNPELFPFGLQLFSDHTKRSQILEAWGDHLLSEKCFEDAAFTYLCCSALEKALKAYRASADWESVFRVAGLLRLGKEEIFQLANDICEELQAIGKPAEAAKIAMEYCMDLARGVDYFIMARHWEEALRMAFMQGQELVSAVKDSALECATSLTSEYSEGLEKVGKYLVRYLAVRQRRILLAAKIKSDDMSVIDPDLDTRSETSSSLSEMSAYTMRTGKDTSSSINLSTSSKAREARRQKHKGGRIRAGSPGEEMALVEHLKGMSLPVTAQNELKTLIVTLVMLGKVEVASKLQSAGEAFQLSQQAAVKLAEDTIGNDTIDENNHTLDNYARKLQSQPHSQALIWQSKALLPTLQVHQRIGS